jgi:hypothetical protein
MMPSPGLGPRIGSGLVDPVALAVATNARLCPLGVVNFPPDLVAVPAGPMVVVVRTDAWVRTVAAILAGLVRLAALVPVSRVRVAGLVRAAQRVAAGPAVRVVLPCPAHPGAASLPRPLVPGSGRTCPAGPRSSSCWQRP